MKFTRRCKSAVEPQTQCLRYDENEPLAIHGSLELCRLPLVLVQRIDYKISAVSGHSWNVPIEYCDVYPCFGIHTKSFSRAYHNIIKKFNQTYRKRPVSVIPLNNFFVCRRNVVAQ